ncbi:MAG: TIGR02594 family protein [Roseibium sp.]
MKYSVRKVQRRLRELGYYAGRIDGIQGPKTNTAIINFKKSKGLAARAYIGPLTLSALFDNARPPKRSTGTLPWMRMALGYLGLREIRGSRHNPQILTWWQLIRAPFTDDETPWCAGFVGGIFEGLGIRSTRSAGARSYEKWGVGLSGPAVGAVVTFWRGKPTGWSGHVGFVVGRDQSNNLMVLGGNQGNAVSIKPFARKRVTSYRWPDGAPSPATGMALLPVVKSDGRLSTNEA